MSAQVEAVAEAIYEAMPSKGWTDGRTGKRMVWADLDDRFKARWIPAAHAAIAAMPTLTAEEARYLLIFVEEAQSGFRRDLAAKLSLIANGEKPC